MMLAICFGILISFMDTFGFIATLLYLMVAIKCNGIFYVPHLVRYFFLINTLIITINSVVLSKFGIICGNFEWFEEVVFAPNFHSSALNILLRVSNFLFHAISTLQIIVISFMIFMRLKAKYDRVPVVSDYRILQIMVVFSVASASPLLFSPVEFELVWDQFYFVTSKTPISVIPPIIICTLFFNLILQILITDSLIFSETPWFVCGVGVFVVNMALLELDHYLDISLVADFEFVVFPLTTACFSFCVPASRIIPFKESRSEMWKLLWGYGQETAKVHPTVESIEMKF
eukprot:NP_001041262.1 Uncharacterized protein CELE_K02B9.3 [Caenorhabditis elegans]